VPNVSAHFRSLYCSLIILLPWAPTVIVRGARHLSPWIGRLAGFVLLSFRRHATVQNTATFRRTNASKLSALGRFRPPPDPLTRGSAQCPWTPPGAPPPDRRYRLSVRAGHVCPWLYYYLILSSRQKIYVFHNFSTHTSRLLFDIRQQRRIVLSGCAERMRKTFLRFY